MSTTTPDIVPMLAYEDGLAAMDWLCRAFGFSEKIRLLDDNGKLAHGELAIGNNTIMLASPTAGYQSPKHHRTVCDVTDKWYQVPYIFNGCLVYVADVKKHCERAKAAGAVILSEVEEGGPGTRYRAEDLEGHRWMFIERNQQQQ